MKTRKIFAILGALLTSGIAIGIVDFLPYTAEAQRIANQNKTVQLLTGGMTVGFMGV